MPRRRLFISFNIFRLFRLFVFCLAILALLPLAPRMGTVSAHLTQAGHNLEMACDIWPPYQSLKEGMPSGFSVEVLSQIFARMDMRTDNIEVFPWARALSMIRSGRVDALFSVNRTPARAVFAHYPDEPLTTSPWVIWSRAADKLDYTTLSDLEGKRVGAVLGYSYTPAFWDYVREHANLQEVVTDEVNFRKLATGRLDYVAAELHNGHSLLSTMGLEGVVAHDSHPIKTDGLYIIFSKSKVPKDFVDEFSRQLSRFKSEDAYRKLRNKYLSPPDVLSSPR